MMLRRRSQLKKKRRIQFLIIFSLFLLLVLLIVTLFRRQETVIPPVLSGSVLISGDVVNVENEEVFSLSGAQQVSLISDTGVLSGAMSVSEGVNNQSGNQIITQVEERSQFFSIQLCNQLFDFYTCVIKNAPLENQSAMQASLDQTIQPWKLMADSQLLETCEAVVKNPTFQEVRDHYMQVGDDYKCMF